MITVEPQRSSSIQRGRGRERERSITPIQPHKADQVLPGHPLADAKRRNSMHQHKEGQAYDIPCLLENSTAPQAACLPRCQAQHPHAGAMEGGPGAVPNRPNPPSAPPPRSQTWNGQLLARGPSGSSLGRGLSPRPSPHHSVPTAAPQPRPPAPHAGGGNRGAASAARAGRLAAARAAEHCSLGIVVRLICSEATSLLTSFGWTLEVMCAARADGPTYYTPAEVRAGPSSAGLSLHGVGECDPRMQMCLETALAMLLRCARHP